jgi:predicted dehydrogenase
MLRQALSSADAVIDACRGAKVRLCYAENWVYAPPVQKARRLLAAAEGPSCAWWARRATPARMRR